MNKNYQILTSNYLMNNFHTKMGIKKINHLDIG